MCIEFEGDSSNNSNDKTYPIQPFISLNMQEEFSVGIGLCNLSHGFQID